MNMINDVSSLDGWILSVETSGRSGSAAIGRGGRVVEEAPFSAPLKHSAELFDVTVRLLDRQGLKAADVGQVYISYGPGSFTGIRIAVTMGKMYSFANSAKIVAVNTLEGAALNALDAIEDGKNVPQRVGVILDAKRGQFFTAVFNIENGKITRAGEDLLVTAEEFKAKYVQPTKPIWLLGEGLVYYKEAFKAYGVEFADAQYWTARAGNVLKSGWEKACRGEYAQPYTLVPHYVRGPEAVVKAGMTPIREV